MNKSHARVRYLQLYSGDSCDGDSGGPLIHRYDPDEPWTQVGIVSFGPHNCASKDVPGVYTQVDQFSDWIKNKLEP